MRFRFSAAALCFSVAFIGSAPPASAAVGDVFNKGPGGERYVALGDSAAAGPLILPQRTDPITCLRSVKNFPTNAARRLNVQAFTDVTCSAAKLQHLTHWQLDNPPQINGVRRDSTLVSFGPMGANDVGLVSTVLSCVFPGCKQRTGDGVDRAIEGLRPRLAAALAAIKTRAPSARLIVVGYGRYLPPNACPASQPISSSDGNFIQGLVDHLDAVLRDAASEAGAPFVDLRAIPGALLHTACAPLGQRWLQGLIPDSDSAPFHPSALGMSAFAGPLVEAAQR